MMRIPETLLLKPKTSLHILLLISLIQTTTSRIAAQNCSASACGIIGNISLPFRLKDDSNHCGLSNYELECQNNVAFVYLNSHRYRVKAINYNNFTIRVADDSVDDSNTCSFPNYSAYEYNFSSLMYPYNIIYQQVFDESPLPINLMSCSHPLNNSSLFTELPSYCDPINSRATYIKPGYMNASDVPYTCRIDVIVMTSWKFKNTSVISLSEIHHSLLYGFELSWFRYPCSKCKQSSYCYYVDADRKFTCGRGIETLLIILFTLLLIFVVFLFIGVTIPGQIMVGYICFLLISREVAGWDWLFNQDKVIVNVLILIGIGLAGLRGLILLPFFIGLFIYKFRRRHLSVFDAIEEFLQSDNKFMPIRYSYSEIKKMTGGFREKLGQGGYGCVYKGKLRSGHHVAVKLLENSRAKGQDFMNEIATIGRIHHVNVVTLVGYSAEGSKRALVYDFMPNGSLEKYILNRDNINSLDWETKYEIAVGVARGIEYLHRGCDVQILHFDIKPHNILLNDKFVPKVSDFGLAKLCTSAKNTVTLTAARGTIGYVAPELLNRGFGGISHKADVYSFGMLLIEMVDLKRDLKGNNENSSQYFPDWIYSCLEQGKDIQFGKTDADDNEEEDDGRRKVCKKMTIVALWCIQMKPDDRPSMNEVVQMLEGRVEQLRIPNRSSLSLQLGIDDEDQNWKNSSDSTSLLPHDAASSSVDIIVEN